MARPKPCAPPVTTAQRLLRSIWFMVMSFVASCAGLTRASILLHKSLSKEMDCRVKPGNEGVCGCILQRPAAVDDVGDAGGERAFVAGEIDRERADFVGRAEPAHRLAA